jgi:hypothetical protein
MPISQVTLSTPAGGGSVSTSLRIEARRLRCVSVTNIDNTAISGLLHARVMFSQNSTGVGDWTVGLLDTIIGPNQSASQLCDLEIPDGAFVVLWGNSWQPMKVRLSIHTEV